MLTELLPIQMAAACFQISFVVRRVLLQVRPVAMTALVTRSGYAPTTLRHGAGAEV